MIVVNSSSVDSVQTSDEIVGRGPVFKKSLIASDETDGFSVLVVSFEPGAKLNFHTHTHEQILCVTGGEGIVATKDEEYTVTPGAVIYIAPGEVHWHGATGTSSFSHIAIQKPGIQLAE